MVGCYPTRPGSHSQTQFTLAMMIVLRWGKEVDVGDDKLYLIMIVERTQWSDAENKSAGASIARKLEGGRR
jgi:hypothetical protein